MGTRSIVKFYSEYDQDEPIMCAYQQFDGYIDGVGYSLANFLNRKTIINGICDQTMENYANGMGCLAAQYVAENKTRIGNFYLTNKDAEEYYNYEVRYIDGKFNIKVVEFNGTPDELLDYKE
jgi:hypothetical protein